MACGGGGVVVATRIQWHFGFNGYSVDDVHTCDKRGEWVDKSHELQKRELEREWDEKKVRGRVR